jgi:hypothetical protein
MLANLDGSRSLCRSDEDVLYYDENVTPSPRAPEPEKGYFLHFVRRERNLI